MARLIFNDKSFKKYVMALEDMKESTKEVCGEVVYEMAKIAGDEVKSRIKGLKAIPDEEGFKAWERHIPISMIEGEKAGLLESFGIAVLRNDNGYLNVKIGFDGYNGVVTQKYPKGQPNAMIARSVESGSSARRAQPFVKPAIKAIRKKAIAAGQKVFEEDLRKRRK